MVCATVPDFVYPGKHESTPSIASAVDIEGSAIGPPVACVYVQAPLPPAAAEHASLAAWQVSVGSSELHSCTIDNLPHGAQKRPISDGFMLPQGMCALG